MIHFNIFYSIQKQLERHYLEGIPNILLNSNFCDGPIRGQIYDILILFIYIYD